METPLSKPALQTLVAVLLGAVLGPAALANDYAGSLKSTQEITTDIGVGGLPTPERRKPPGGVVGGGALQPPAQLRGHVFFAYASPATSYRGLLFQDVNLERYGSHYGRLQPAASAAHFTSRVLALPYSYVAQRGWKTEYSLGYGRPGSHSTPGFYLGR